MKKPVKFIDIILTEQELKFNKAFKKRHNLGLKGLPLYFTAHVLVNAKYRRVNIATLSALNESVCHFLSKEIRYFVI